MWMGGCDNTAAINNPVLGFLFPNLLKYRLIFAKDSKSEILKDFDKSWKESFDLSSS
jgi:hypothetical protein